MTDNDLAAIREDIGMAHRSGEMARHVALDHSPELCDEIETLRAQIAAARALADAPAHVTLLHAAPDTGGYAVVWPEDLLRALDGEVADGQP